MPPARVRPFAPVGAGASASLPAASVPASGERVRPDWAASGARLSPGKLTVVGYIERIALPRWGIVGLSAKVDTGAETSALHVEGLRLVGATRVTFEVAASDEEVPLAVEARIVRRGLVRSSNGHTEERVFVRSSLTLCGRSQSVEIGLVNRSQMEYRMLIGRSALAGAFLVDPSRFAP